MSDSMNRTGLEAALAELTERSLSRDERYSHVALMLLAVVMAVGLVVLLLTEPQLPPRASVAFGVMIAIALAWIAYAWRVLSHRWPLLVNREVVAARMSLLFTTIFTVGTIIVGLIVAGRPHTPATWMGATTMLMALALLLRAKSRRARLQALRERLERELGHA